MTDGDQVVLCEECESDKFNVIYDPLAQGYHVQCLYCETVCLKVRSA